MGPAVFHIHETSKILTCLDVYSIFIELINSNDNEFNFVTAVFWPCLLSLDLSFQ